MQPPHTFLLASLLCLCVPALLGAATAPGCAFVRPGPPLWQGSAPGARICPVGRAGPGRVAFSSVRGLRAAAAGAEAAALKAKIRELSAGTDAGVSASAEIRAKIGCLIAELKALNPTPKPAESALLDGKWRVQYSTAPPPSNGQLGPFIGSAFQSVDLRGGVYTNLLVVGDEASGGWLKAVLLADWQVLDANRWKVFFRSLDISVLGFKVVGQKWEDNTRIWDMGYLDDDTRIVFGARDEASESVVFYMTRD